MGISVEEQRKRIRQQNREKQLEILNERLEKKFNVSDYFVKGIYFLYNKGKIVYIGKSDNNVFKRISDHYTDKDKIFDSFTFDRYDIDSNDLLHIEASLIKRYKPKYNIMHKVKKRVKIYYCAF